MKKITDKIANQFLDLDWAEKFLNQKRPEIFKGRKNIKLLNIKRSSNVNPNHYNILYILEVDRKKVSLRFSTSLIDDREPNFLTLKYLYNHGFSRGDILVSKPIAFLKEYNLMIYEDIDGNIFKNELYQDLSILEKRVKLAAVALKKIHAIPNVPFNIWNPDWAYNIEAISKFYPILAVEIGEIRRTIWARIMIDRVKCFCHGDYSPDNLIFKENKLYLIDFGSVSISDKEIDLASFTIKTKIILKKIGEMEKFPNLRKGFLDTYGVFEEEKYSLYSALFSIRVLDFFIAFPDYENNKKFIPFGYELVKDNLEKIGIRITNA